MKWDFIQVEEFLTWQNYPLQSVSTVSAMAAIQCSQIFTRRWRSLHNFPPSSWSGTILYEQIQYNLWKSTFTLTLDRLRFLWVMRFWALISGPIEGLELNFIISTVETWILIWLLFAPPPKKKNQLLHSIFSVYWGCNLRFLNVWRCCQATVHAESAYEI